MRLRSFCLALLLPSAMGAALAQRTIQVPANQPTIQAGIDSAANGDTVTVAPGTYLENIDYKGKTITVTSSGGSLKTIIDGRSLGPVVTIGQVAGGSSTLSGFTILHGAAANGAVSVIGGATIANNIISHSAGDGISIYDFYGFNSVVQGNTISSNAGNGIRGVFYYGTNTIAVSSNTIQGNSQTGVLIQATNPQFPAVITPNIANNIISGNGQQGIGVSYADTTVVQNLIYGNGFPGIESFGASGIYMANNTFAFNGTSLVSVVQGGTEITLGLGDGLRAVNNIIVGNSAFAAYRCYDFTGQGFFSDHNDIVNLGTGPASGFSICDFGPGTFGNLSLDPHFKNPATGDFHLTQGSPAVDAGNNSVTPLFATDLDGNPRLQDATSQGCPVIDMGAYELAGVVGSIPPTITLASSTTSIVLGMPFTFVATLASPGAVPQGVVTFYSDGLLIGSAPINSAGVATLASPNLPTGLHGISASYAGQAGVCPAQAVHIYVTVSPAAANATSTTLTCSPNPNVPTVPLNLVATVTSTSGVPTGTVSFTENGTTLGTAALANGAASFSTLEPQFGLHTIVATYVPGASGLAASSGSCTETIATIATSTTLSVTPTATTSFLPVVITSTVLPASSSSAPLTGVVTFYANGVSIFQIKLGTNGTASSTWSNFGAGRYSITASYSGDGTGDYAASTSAPVTLVVSAANTVTTLAAVPNPAYLGQVVLLQGTVSAQGTSVTPTGQVQILELFPPTTFATLLATVPISASGAYSFPTSNLPLGVDTLEAAYVPSDANFQTSLAALNVIILARDFTLTPETTDLTIQTQHHASLGLTLAPIGNFADTILLSCSNLPAVTTCAFHPNQAVLTANGPVQESVTIETDAVPGYKSRNGGLDPIHPLRKAIALAALFPVGFLLFGRQRRTGKLRRLGIGTLLALAASAAAPLGCSSLYPASTPPATYSFNINGTGATTGITHSVTITLVVTE